MRRLLQPLITGSGATRSDARKMLRFAATEADGGRDLAGRVTFRFRSLEQLPMIVGVALPEHRSAHQVVGRAFDILHRTVRGGEVAMGRRVLLVILLVGLAGGCASGPTFDEVATTLSPAPAGDARIIVYRAFEPYQSLSWVPVAFNGANVGAVGPGSVFVRDVPSGNYDIAPLSQGLYPNQDKVVLAAPGQTYYAKVESFQGLDPSANRDVPLTTFVVVLVDPETARREIGPLRYTAQQRKGQFN